MSAFASTPLNPEGAPFARFEIGGIEIFQVLEGETARDLDPGFFSNVAVDSVDAALRDGGFPPCKIPNSYTVTLARIGGSLIMFDAGLGEHGRPRSGQLQANMGAAGLDASGLSAIVVTHFHPDHIFGLMTASNEQVYPHLPIHVPAAEFDFWTGDPERIPKSRQALAQRIRETLPHWDNIVRYEADSEILPAVRSVPSYGHSAGHTSLLLDAGGAQVCVMGDVTNVPAFNMAHPDWHLAADDFPEMAERTRRHMLDWAAGSGIACTGYHWGLPGLGRIVRSGSGYRLEALEMN